MLNLSSLFVFRVRDLVNRAIVIAGILLYVGVYNYLYIHWLAPTFDYAGMTYHPPDRNMLLAAWCLAVLPSLWMPIKLARPSQLPFWFIYLLVYVPSLFSPLYMALQPDSALALLMACLFAGMVILSLGYLWPTVRLVHSLIPPPLFWPLVVALTVVLDLWIISIYHSHMHLVGFNAVYDLRSQSTETGQGTGAGYGQMLLETLLDPLFIAFGLFVNRKSLVVIGALNQLMLYSIDGGKAEILSVVILIGLYLIIGRSGRTFGPRLIAAISAVVLVLLLIALFADTNPILKIGLTLLFSRTFAVGGYNTGIYSSFFATHPLTHLSSVHGINFFVHYPYAEPLGYVVGYGAVGSRDLDANAHFWATDGIAAFGPLGIIFISVVCAVVFWILDSVASRHDVVFCALTLSMSTLVLTNVSLFTTLVSGGLGLLILVLMGMPSTLPVHAKASESLSATT